jgi:hypothetical protein
MLFRARNSAGRVGIGITAVVVTVLGALALPAFTATSAQASSALRIHPSYGYRINHGRDFVGAYRMSNGRMVYCINPTYGEPATVALSTKTRLPRLSATVTAEVSEALFAHGHARTNWQAAVESQTLNWLIGNKKAVAARAHFLPKSVGSRVTKYVAEARRFHGPYRVRVSTPTALLPGQSAHGTVSLSPARAGILVRLASSSNAAVTRAVRTGSRGTARFTYRVRTPGEVHIAARAMNLPPTTLLASDPKGRVQRMLSWRPAATHFASASFQGRVSGFSHTYGCTSTCNGHPVTTMRACVASSIGAQRVLYRYAGHTKIVSWAASSRGSCKSTSLTLKDGDRVTATRQYHSSRGWSAQVAIGGTFVVDCPAAPGVAANVVFSCTTASVTIALGVAAANGSWTPTSNASAHRYVLDITGATTRHIYADHGKTATATFRMACGAHKTFTFRGGVRRANGHYNYTPLATVVSP